MPKSTLNVLRAVCWLAGVPSARGLQTSLSSAYANAKAMFSPSNTGHLSSTHRQTAAGQGLSSTHGQTRGLQKEGSLTTFSPGSTSRLSSTPAQTQRLHKEGSLGGTYGPTSRLQKEHSWADEVDQQWRSAASSYAAEVLHPAPRFR